MTTLVKFDARLAKEGKPVQVRTNQYGLVNAHYIGITSQGLVAVEMQGTREMELSFQEQCDIFMRQPEPQRFWSQVTLIRPNNHDIAIVTRPVETLSQCEALAKEQGMPYGSAFQVEVPGEPF